MKQPDNPFCTRTASRRWLALSLLLLLTIGLRRAAAPPIALAQTPVQSRIQVSAEVFQAVTQRGAARVLILLDDQALRSAAAAQRPALVAELQQRVLGNLRADDFQRYRQYRYVAGVAGTLSAAGLAQLQAEPLVVAIQLDHPGQAHLEDSLPALGGHLVHNNDGITGKGVTVAVLDSGIDSDHPDLSAALIAQHCFTNGNCPPNATTESTLAEDVNGHGTHVAGVIASAGNVAGTGFAPDAKIVAVRVLDANGSGFVSDWIAGLDWVRANRATTPVQIVNLSLGTFALYPGNCDAQEPVLAAAISQLRAQGVTIFASSGNQGSSTRIAAPACNSGVIAVGATYDGNVGRQPDTDTYQQKFGFNWPACADLTTTLQTITCFTNSNSQLDLVAPGAPLASSYLGGGTTTFWGTSQASPTAAGIAALLLERNPALTPDMIETTLKASGPQLTDPKNNRQFTAINARAAVDLLKPVAPQSVTVDGPTTGVISATYHFMATVMPLTVTLPLTYHWQATDLATVAAQGGQKNGVSFAWASPGPKTVTVTALNAGGAVSQTQQLTITPIAPSAIVLQGPSRGQVGSAQRFTATVTPLTVTLPLTYSWQVSGGTALTQRGGLTAHRPLSWEQPGRYTVAVQAFNASGAVSATQLILIEAIAPLTVVFSSELTSTVGMAMPIVAHVLPLTVSLPLTYYWQATDQLPITHTAGISDSVSYRWLRGGPVTVTLRVANRMGEVSKAQQLQVTDRRRLYLPVVAQP